MPHTLLLPESSHTEGGLTGAAIGVDFSDWYRVPEPPISLESAESVVDDEVRRSGLYAALSFLATEACLNPDSLGEVREHIEAALRRHYRPKPDMPTMEYASQRIWLAGTMGAIYSELPDIALSNRPYGAPPKLGPPECYVVNNPDTGEAIVEAYEEGSPEDLQMRTVPELMEAGEQLVEMTTKPGGKYTKFAPVVRLEEEIRSSLPRVDHRRNTQHNYKNLSPNPLDPEVIRLTASQFMRNVMHGILLIADTQVGEPSGVRNATIMRSIRALEVAAMHPRDMQRAFMGVPGDIYEAIRKARNVIPHATHVGDGYYMINGLLGPPANATACSGVGSHRNTHECGRASAIEKFMKWELRSARHTMFNEMM